MASELATMLHKLDRDTEERADKREKMVINWKERGKKKINFRSRIRGKAEGTGKKAWNADAGYDV